MASIKMISEAAATGQIKEVYPEIKAQLVDIICMCYQETGKIDVMEGNTFSEK